MRSLGLISSSTSPWIRSSPFTSSNRFTLKFPASVRCDFSNPKKLSSSDFDSNGGTLSRASISVLEDQSINNFKLQVGTPKLSSIIRFPKLSLSDQAFLLLAFIAFTTSMAFTSFVIATVPTLVAMGRAASSFAKLADTARKELPSTLAAIRLSGMEISDLTLELSDLSQDIADGVNKSAKAVKAAEAGIKQIGTLAQHQTLSMIEERASLPEISLQPLVVGAAEKTSQAIGKASKTLMNIITGGDKVDDSLNP